MAPEAWSDAISWMVDLSPDIRRRVTASFQVMHIRKEKALYYQEDRAVAAYLVLEGSVRHVIWTDTGATLLVTQANPGSWCGLAETCRHGVYLTDATTNEESRVAAINAPGLESLFELPPVRNRIIGDLAQGYTVLYDLIAAQTPRTRIARHLLFLRGEQNPGGDAIRTTQESIAHSIGLSRETVNKHLHELNDRRIIDIRRGVVTVLDSIRLESIATGV